MTSSLRSRLWLSYAGVIFVMLFVAAIALVVTLRNSNILYRQTLTRLYVVGSTIVVRIEQLPRMTQEREQALLEKEAEIRKLRLALIAADGAVVYAVGPGSEVSLDRLRKPLVESDPDNRLYRTLRDQMGSPWLYTLHNLPDGRFLMVAAPKPVFSARDLWRSEILSPILQAALIALVLATALSLLIGQWIARPLREMALAAHRMEAGHYQPVALEGPREVQQLGQALNQMAHQVQSAQQSQRDFLANVSHELKTPLTSIQGFAQAIVDGTVQTQEALQQAGGIIYQEAGRMSGMVMDLLSLARLEAGAADLQARLIHLSTLLQSIAQKYSLQDARVHVCDHFEADLFVAGDEERLEQVFANLIDNALKFSPQEGQVTLCAWRQVENVLVSVHDQGMGIPPHEQARIFERFYQVDPARGGGAGRGTGLGLAIVAQIVAAHGGRVWVESQPGQGATFTVSLPQDPLKPVAAARNENR